MSVVLHVAVKLFHGEGTFADTLFVVGWSAPIALLIPLAIIVGLFVGVGAGGSAETVLRDGDAIRDSVDGLSTVTTAIVLCWQGYVWTRGVELTHDMDTSSALLPVVVTVGIGLFVVVGGT